MIIEIIEGCGNSEIKEYLNSNDKTIFFSDPNYINLVSNHLKCKPYWIVAKKDNSIQSVLPFMIKDGKCGKVFNSLPYFGSNGGVIQNMNNTKLKAKMISTYYDYFNYRKGISATIITSPFEKDIETYESQIKYDFKDYRIGQITYLDRLNDYDDLINSYQNPRPRNIRKAIKEGVTIEQSQSDEAIEILFNIHYENINSISGRTKKKSFFTKIPKYINRDQWTIYQAKKEDKVIANLLVFYCNKTVEYFTPGTIADYRSIQPLALIIYKAMQDAVSKKMLYWNWGGSSPTQLGIYDYKRKWGTIDHNYYYYTAINGINLINKKKDFILKEYEGFYCLPFNALR